MSVCVCSFVLMQMLHVVLPFDRVVVIYKVEEWCVFMFMVIHRLKQETGKKGWVSAINFNVHSSFYE